MILRRGSKFWQPLAVQILTRQDGKMLSEKKVRTKLVNRAAAQLGVQAGDKGLRESVDQYLRKARARGALQFEGNHVLLPDTGSSRLAGRNKEAQPEGDKAAGDRDSPTASSAGGVTTGRRGEPQVQASTDAASAPARLKQEEQAQKPGEAVLPNKKKRKNTRPLQGSEAADSHSVGAAAVTGAQPAEQGQGTRGAKKRKKGELHAAAQLAARGGSAVLASAETADAPSSTSAAKISIGMQSTPLVHSHTASLRENGGAVQAAPKQAADGVRKKAKRVSGAAARGPEQNGGAGQAIVAAAGDMRLEGSAVVAGGKRMSDTLARALARLRAERPGGASAAPQVVAGKAAKQTSGKKAKPVQAPASSAPKAAGKPASSRAKRAAKQRASKPAHVGTQEPGSSVPNQAADEPAGKTPEEAKANNTAKIHAECRSRKKTGSTGHQDPQPELVMPAIPGAEMPRGWHDKRTDVKTGYFSKQERQAIRDGAEEYARQHGFSTDDLGWLFATRVSTNEQRRTAVGAWTAIAERLPRRRLKAVWAAGTRLLHAGNFLGRWSKEETAKLQQLVVQLPGRWTEIGLKLGRLPEGVRDKWREIAMGPQKHSGRWTLQEEGTLVEAVNTFLAEREAHEAKTGEARSVTARPVLDDISWDVVSRALGTRTPAQCKQKWYGALSPSMVSRGDWGAGDDRRMLRALLQSGAAAEWEVDWAALVQGRSGQNAKRRWRLMLKCVPEPYDKEFDEIVDYLVETYAPYMRAIPAAEEQTSSEDEEGGEDNATAERAVVSKQHTGGGVTPQGEAKNDDESEDTGVW